MILSEQFVFFMSVHAIDLDLDLLRCFLTVVEGGGFERASKRLHLTQSAITLKIKRLEGLLQRRLFLRTSKPLQLSPEGEIVLGYASHLWPAMPVPTNCSGSPAKGGPLVGDSL